MAARCCLMLLFALLSGTTQADILRGEPASLNFTVVASNENSAYFESAPNMTNSTEIGTTTLVPPTNSTTEAPVTTQNSINSTTEAPVTTQNSTNSTTEAPTTTHSNVTSAPTSPPTPPPTTPPVPKPDVGSYNVKDSNITDCLLAKMGLQFSFRVSENGSLQTVNLNPNATTVNGTCGSGGSSSSLLLTTKEITVYFLFTNVSKKFQLHALEFTVDLGNGVIFNESNTNLSLWEASVGSSYMCKREQSYNVTDKLTLNTIELQIQPFDVKKNVFSTAHECSLDDASLLIPIIVGAALAGLILIVVIAYVIGRRRTYVGYQTL